MSHERLLIFDTTLRDGEQSPGASMTSKEKSIIAIELSRLGVDIIEAGFPAASPDDLAAVRHIAETVGQAERPWRSEPAPPAICGLARTTKGDIDAAWEAVSHAAHPRIHTFLATSPIHREHKLKMSKAEVLDRIREMVGYARSLCEDIEFSPEDAGRTEPEFLHEAVETAIAAGATTINIPDTVGYTTPEEFGALIAGIMESVPNIGDVVISVHCHNDLGLAVANTLAAVQAGARQAEVTVNGIGERAGNTALEEVVMALQTRPALYPCSVEIDTTRICRASALISRTTGIGVQPNKAIVGSNAFAHEAGIHQDGMLKHNQTYEIMRPEDVGAGATKLVLGKHSGRHAFGTRLSELGFELEDKELKRAFIRFKELADIKKTVTDIDLEALAADESESAADLYTLHEMQVASGTNGTPTATVSIVGPDGSTHVGAAVGTGPVDAVFCAMADLLPEPLELSSYRIEGNTEGNDALGVASVRLRRPGAPVTERSFHGNGTDVDVIVASARAYLSAANSLLSSVARSAGDDSKDPAPLKGI